jgi:hypothetical protein
MLGAKKGRCGKPEKHAKHEWRPKPASPLDKQDDADIRFCDGRGR